MCNDQKLVVRRTRDVVITCIFELEAGTIVEGMVIESFKLQM